MGLLTLSRSRPRAFLNRPQAHAYVAAFQLATPTFRAYDKLSHNTHTAWLIAHTSSRHLAGRLQPNLASHHNTLPAAHGLSTHFACSTRPRPSPPRAPAREHFHRSHVRQHATTSTAATLHATTSIAVTCTSTRPVPS